jgi:hypothetical protein
MICPKCKKNKQRRSFSRNITTKSGLQVNCKDCFSAYHRRRRVEDPDLYKKSSNRVLSISLVKKVLSFFDRKSCVDCGESNPLVLQFDHIRGTKNFSIANALVQRYSWETILSEIEKCDIRCANCHSIVTHKRKNSIKWQLLHPELEMTLNGEFKSHPDRLVRR